MNFLKKNIWLVSIALIVSCAAKKKATTHARKDIEEKYSQLLATDKGNISNVKLYSVIDDWYGVKYKFGGKSKDGIDCSGLTAIIYKEVFNKELSGSAAAIYNLAIKVKKDSLQEGDLVFFCTNSKSISHMGIYLQNNKFVHASSKAGVMISDLNEDYFKKCFKGSGRIL